MPPYLVTADPALIDIPTLHRALLRKYICHAPSLDTLEKSFANSLNFAVLTATGDLAAYARVITDRSTFAHLADVFVLDEHRGQSLSKLLIQAIFAHPDLQTISRFTHPDDESKPFFHHSGFPSAPVPILAIARPV